VPRLGVLGWPVSHSRSPAMQTAALAGLGLDGWSYQRLPVPPDAFAETVRALPAAGFAGANVTIPHKEAALAVSDTATDRARAIGAANTLTFGPGGTIAADNTDAPGLLAALVEPVAGRTALVLGAGGAARAVVWALLDAGATDVALWNRTQERAERLARELGARAVRASTEADLLVNCTAAGLDGTTDPFKDLPFRADALSTYDIVADMVYTPGHPEGSELVAQARRRGCRTVDGLEVLVRQGALSLEAWTGRAAPLDTMRRAAHQPPAPSTP
jgi:shikimate dehydrogenase